MKFTVEITKTLRITNDDGLLAILQEGDEVYLKLDFLNMKVWNLDWYTQRYPDSWIKGRIHHISNAGKKISIELCDRPGHYLMPNQKHILDVSDKAPREELV